MEDNNNPSVRYAIFCGGIKRTEPGKFNILDARDGIEEKLEWKGEGQPPKEHVLKYPIKLLIGLLDISTDKHEIGLEVIRPSGIFEKSSEPQEFTGEDVFFGLARVLVNLELDIVENGTYLFNIILDGKLLTEIKLPVVIHRL